MRVVAMGVQERRGAKSCWVIHMILLLLCAIGEIISIVTKAAENDRRSRAHDSEAGGAQEALHHGDLCHCRASAGEGGV